MKFISSLSFLILIFFYFNDFRSSQLLNKKEFTNSMQNNKNATTKRSHIFILIFLMNLLFLLSFLFPKLQTFLHDKNLLFFVFLIKLKKMRDSLTNCLVMEKNERERESIKKNVRMNKSCVFSLIKKKDNSNFHFIILFFVYSWVS